MTDLPRIAFCITCKNRTPHLKMTLPQNLRDNADYPNAHFVLLNYGSEDDLMDFVRDGAGVREALDDNRLTVYTYPNVGPFQMAKAKNMAHRLAIWEGADILVNLDADNYTGVGFAEYIAAQFAGRDDLFLAIGEIIQGVTPRGLCGRIVVTAHAFLQLGGYDERFETWSPDDKDFNQRLCRLGYERRPIAERYMDCIRHNDKMRFREYPHVRTGNDCETEELASSDNTVVNYGLFGCGVVTRNFDSLPLTLGPLPTRIFGIGMHKTGTTSLHMAFKHLGIHSAHWLSAHWAKKIWREMNTLGYSHTLERHYALCDMPIGNLFRQLDRAYPGSKFILTTREESAWLDSVRRHWDVEHNPWRANWGGDPFTSIIHKHTYGQTHFDSEVMLTRFRQHNAEVSAHFRHRPHDLLVLNLDKRQGWRTLCAFLGKVAPAIPYPKANPG